jgi:hypothetical protein
LSTGGEMEESCMGLLLSNENKEDIKESIKFYNALILDLKNTDVPLADIVARFGEKTGRSVVEIERDFRNNMADQLQQVVDVMEAFIV